MLAELETVVSLNFKEISSKPIYKESLADTLELGLTLLGPTIKSSTII